MEAAVQVSEIIVIYYLRLLFKVIENQAWREIALTTVYKNLD